MAASRSARLANFAVAAATVRVALARPATRASMLTARTPTPATRHAYSTAPPPPSDPANVPRRCRLLRAIVKELVRVPTPQQYFERGFRLAIVLGAVVAFVPGPVIAVVDSTTGLFSSLDVFTLSYGSGLVVAALVLVGHGFMFPVMVAAGASALLQYAYVTVLRVSGRRTG